MTFATIGSLVQGAKKKKGRGRPRIYDTNAERQRAYRLRKRGKR